MPVPADAMIVFKLVLVAGFAVWSAIAALNNLVGFDGSVAAIGRTLGMQPLREAAIEIPMLRRALPGRAWAVLALIVLVALQVLATVLLGWGAWQLLDVLVSGGEDAAGIAASMLGLASLAAAWLLMIVGGLWFCYWIREEALQMTHMVLLALTIGVAVLLRL